MLTALLLLTTAHAIEFSATGDCGETIAIEVSDTAARSNFSFLLGYGPGSDAIAAGRCAGVDSGLNLYTFSRIITTDADGIFSMDWEMPDHLCGTAVAVLDVTTCEVSSMVVLGEADDDGGDAGDLVTTVDNGDGTFTSSVDATSYDDWVYVSLASGAQVSPADPLSSYDWDIAFRRYEIIVNGGISGIGEVTAMWLDYETWGYAVPYEGAIPPFGWTTDSDDAFVMGDWYDYDFLFHTLSPKPGIYLVDGISDVYALEFLDYYDDAGDSGVPSYLWHVVD